MKYLSVCSGIASATVAWKPLGFTPVGFSEIEKFPCTLLDYYYPNVPNLGDLNALHKVEAYEAAQFDILVGGTPCQSFSVAGNRKGLDDARGKLLYSYLRVLAEKQPAWFVWENVPGVLFSNKGRDFGFFLWSLAKLGYGFAYRVLDAQFFGVPQRRRRVFVVGHIRDWRRAAAVLFEQKSVCRNIAQGKKKKQSAAVSIASGIRRSSQQGHIITTHDVSPTINSRDHKGLSCGRDGLTGAAVIAIQANAIRPNPQLNGIGWSEKNVSYTLTSADRHAVAIHENARNELRLTDVSPTLSHSGGGKAGQGYQAVLSKSQVRRLTPLECERLQGLPDNYTRIPWRKKTALNCPDSPRYQAIGNAMAVPVVAWIGRRILKVDAIEKATKHSCVDV